MDLTSTRFWIAIGSIILCFLLTLLGKMTGTEFVAGLGVIYGFYSVTRSVDNANTTK